MHIGANILKGYTWNGYLSSNKEIQEDIENKEEIIEMPLDNISLKATTKINEYSIEYELNGGTLSNSNPETYTVETESFTLNNPTKTGYTFIGWTGSNGDEPQENVVVEKGSTEDKRFVANWNINTYTIEYELNGGTLSNNNPETYTIETETFTLNNPTKIGYTFIGWTGSNGDKPQKNVIVEKGSTEDKRFVANWNINTYTIEYELNGGTLLNINPETYTVETESFTLNNPIKTGYTFIGWTGSNGDEPEEVITIEKGSTENRRYIANYKINEYTIVYDANGGYVEKESVTKEYNEEIIMPIPERKYTVTYETLGGTELTPEKIQYDFNGWYTQKENGEKREYTKMPAYDETVYAIWTDKSIELKSTYKEGYTFLGWYLDEEYTEKAGTESEIYKVTADVTLYAKWKINEYTITVHHKEIGTDNKIAEDETFIGEYQTQYEITDLITNAGENQREEINTNKYFYENVDGISKGTYTNNIEITFYYGVYTFNITGEAAEGGKITDIAEIVRYGETTSKDIIITPNEGNKVKSITINDEEIEFTEDEDSKVVELPKFTNVTENKNIKVTFEIIPMRVIITESPVESLVGTKYETLRKALLAIETAGLTSESNVTTISLLQNIDDESNIIENKNLKIELNGQTLNSKNDSPTLTVISAQLNIIDTNEENGKISNEKVEAIKIEESGKVTLGTDDESVSQVSPTIQGVRYGVNTKGTFNYYDGKIIGNVAINGNPTDLPYLKNPGITVEEGNQIATLVTVLNAEATIGKKNFTQLELAIEYANNKIAEDGSQVEIVIVKDLTKEEEITVDETKNIKLDLNGFVTTLNATFVNNGKLEIIDTSEENTGKLVSNIPSAIVNKNNMIINGGSFETNLAGTSNAKVYLIRNEEYLEVNNGSVVTTANYINTIQNAKNLKVTNGNINASGTDSSAIYNETTGNLVTTGGTIYAYGSPAYGIFNDGDGYVECSGISISTGTTYLGVAYPIWNNSTGNIKIQAINISMGGYYGYACYNNGLGKIELIDGQINTYGRTDTLRSHGAFYNRTNGTIKIEGGTITARGIGINNASTGKVEITDGNISGYNGVENASGGNIEVSGGTINGSYVGILNSNDNGKIIITGGIVESNRYAIQNEKMGTISIEKAIVRSNNSYSAIYGRGNGDIIVKSGEITSKYGGIYIENTANVILGNKDGIINSESPNIVAEQYGINNSKGKIYYYDGTITANIDKTIIGNIADKEEDAYLKIEDVDEKNENATMASKENVVSINDVEYSSLEEALKNANTGDTIKLLKNITISKDLDVEENKNIIIDMNSKQIKLFNQINNYGTLKIIDNSEEKAGIIKELGEKIINKENAILSIENIKFTSVLVGLDSNTKTIIVNQGTLNINETTLNSSGYRNYSIHNAGNLNIKNANIITTGERGYGICNEPSGIVEIDNITISTKGQNANGILNFGKLNIKSGNIKTEGSYYPYGIYNTGELEVGTVEIYARDNGIYNNAKCIINGAKFNSSSHIAIYNGEQGDLTITTAEVSGNYAVLDNYGIAKIYNGVYNTNNTSILNEGSGSIEFYDGTITTSYCGIYNYDTGKVLFAGGSIHSTRDNAIYNKKSGEIKVTGGSLVTEQYASIYNNDTGTIIVGEKDGIVSTEFPYIKGTYGVSNGKGTFNFYDGILIGNENQSTYGTINEIEDEYDIVKTKNDDNTESAVLKILPMAKILSTGEEYSTIQKAIEAVNENEETIQIIRNIEILSTAESITIPENKNIILDLNNFVISTGKAESIINNGKLKITDNSEEKKGRIKGFNEKVLINNENATLEFENANLTAEYTSATNSDRKNLIVNNGSMKVTGGEMIFTGSYCYGIQNNNILNIYSGTFKSDGVVVRIINSTGDLNIYGGEMTANPNEKYYSNYSHLIVNDGNMIIEDIKITTTKSYYISISNNGTAEINGGEITNYDTNIVNSGNLKINSATINCTSNSSSVIDVYNGSVEINGGTITSKNRIINNKAESTVTINGGNMQSDGGNAIYNSSNGNIIINDGLIKSKGTMRRGIINDLSGTITVNGGEIISENYTAITNDEEGTVIVNGGKVKSLESWGISNNSTGTIIVGDKTKELLAESPIIEGATYGIDNCYGKLYFYNGSIIGSKEQSIYGKVTEIREESNIIKTLNEDETLETSTLGVKNVAKIASTQVEYRNLASAISAITTNDETVQIINDDVIAEISNQIVIPEEKTITIDLNGHELQNSRENWIVNNGKLKLDDSTEEKQGKIITYGNKTLVNNQNAILDINNISIINNAIEGNSSEYCKIIENDGTLNINNVQIKANGEYIQILYNKNNGTINVRNGTILGTGCYISGILNLGNAEFNSGSISYKNNNTYSNSGNCIYNEKDATLNITGGKFESKNNSIINHGNMEISNAEIIANKNGIYAGVNSITKYNNGNITSEEYGIYTDGKFDVYGGTVYGKDVGIYNKSITNVYGGEIKSNSIVIRNQNNTVTIYDGKITMKSSSGQIGIANYSTGEINIKNVEINLEIESNRVYGIYNDTTGTINIEKMKMDLVEKSTSYKAYGIYNDTTGKIVLGIKDKNVDNNQIIINSTGYGVYIDDENGQFCMYDGTIIGQTKAIEGKCNMEYEDRHKLNITDNETKANLIPDDVTYEQIVSVGSIYYDSIQEALNAIETEGTILIHKDLELKAPIIIPAEKNITLDLQASAINYDDSKNAMITIEENAKLTIIDSREDGTETTTYGNIENTSGTTIINKGTLVIGVNDEIVYTNSPRITGKILSIQNIGSLQINDGTIGKISNTGTVEDNR